MTKNQLEHILLTSIVSDLKDKNGSDIPAIGFASVEDARAAYIFLRDCYHLWKENPDMVFKPTR